MRLRLELGENTGLHDVPWEFLFDERRRDFHVLKQGRPLVRQLRGAEPLDLPIDDSPLRVLAMGARPTGWERLDLKEEERVLREALAPLQQKKKLVLNFVRGQTLKDLKQRMLEPGGWSIFHFMGHGGKDAEGERCLLFCDRANNPDPVPAIDLDRILCPNLRLVVLNSCESSATEATTGFGSIAEKLAHDVPAVVAMQYPITDDAAIIFSECFYETLVNGTTVDDALASARQEMARKCEFQWGVPSLHLRTSSSLYLVTPPSPSTEILFP